jgi:choline oxidase
VLARREDGSTVAFTARCKVLLCCGAIDTPRLLMLSGVGPAGQLRQRGIEVVADLAGLGAA